MSADAYHLMNFPSGKTALNTAVAITDDNWSKWVKRLIKMGGDTSSRDGSGETPIFIWARNGRAIFEENEEERRRELI